MAGSELDRLWNAFLPDRLRPQLYASNAYNEDGYQPLTDPQDFIMDVNSLNSQQMYALAANGQAALQAAQDEYFELERIANRIKNPDPLTRPPVKNPQIIEDRAEYEERKEAELYRYKYESKRPLRANLYGAVPIVTKDLTEQEKYDSRVEPEPFSQGGFVPNKRQYESIRSKAKDPRNPDGWIPIERNGRKMIPKMYVETEQERKERYGAGANKLDPRLQGAILLNGDGSPAASIEGGAGPGTPGPINKLLRSTRFGGGKIPPTRDISEIPSLPPSRASTPKRKRGDTPLPSIENGSPLKKIKATETTIVKPKRKGQNQWTKKREREEAERKAREQTTDAWNKSHDRRDRQKRALDKTVEYFERLAEQKREAQTVNSTLGEVVQASEITQNGSNKAGVEPFWKKMTAAEKFAKRGWQAQDLLAAVADDWTWLGAHWDIDDPNLDREIRDKILTAKATIPTARNPIRSWAASRTWLEWTVDGKNKRGPRSGRKIKTASSEGVITREGTEAVEDIGGDELAITDTTILSPSASRVARVQRVINYGEAEDDVMDSPDSNAMDEDGSEVATPDSVATAGSSYPARRTRRAVKK